MTITSPGTVELLPIPDARDPLTPASLEVVGRTVCSLVSPGTEVSGAFRPGPERPARYPVTPGYAAVFRVEAVGSEVPGLAVGDLVYTQGGHRSHQRRPADEVVRLPEGLDPFAAVFARLMAVPMATLSTTAARPGDLVGVSGLGPVGHLAAVIFAVSGYDVTAWDPRAERRALLPAAVRTLPTPPEPEPIGQFGTAAGFDLVLECSGNDGAALECVRRVRALGEVVLVGTPWTRRTDATAHELLHEVFHRYAVLRSGWEWQLPASPTPFTGRSAARNLELAFRWLRSGTVGVQHLADRRAPADAQDVYDELAAGTAERLTTVFDWGV
ncbi:zinc-binding alcohol dehydrogenase [Lysobacter korlensis]|uniref:Zinc-binding alcohol dehydrogenase n=1 Tax=Lysobacter korlensis TaxID=553636 RepID=A0ABV6RUV4_9GAMM